MTFEDLCQAANKPLLLCSLLSDTLKPLLQKGTQAEAFIWEKAESAIDELTKVISSVCTFEKKYIY